MPAEKITVSQISSSHVSNPVAVEGRINKIWPIKVKLIEGAFKCQRCGDITIIKQPIADKQIKPFECLSDECGRKGPFELIPEKSTWIDEQKLELQDLNPPPERDIIVLVRGKDLIDTIPAVDAHVVIIGTIRVIENDNSSVFERVLETNHIETINYSSSIVNVGMVKNQRERIKVLREIIRNLQNEHKGAVPIKEIISKAEESGIKKETVAALLQKLKSAGEIIEASEDRYRVV